MTKDLQSRTLDVVRFPLAIMVVFIHCYGDVSTEIPNTISAIGYENTRILCSKILPHIAVPLFYIISGYLFFVSFKGRWSTSLWRKKMGRRFWSLLVPYIIWNIIPVFVYCCSVILGSIIHQKPFEGFGEHFEKCMSWHMFWDFSSENGLTFPLNLPLWFIRDLMINLVISPFIFLFVKILRIWGVLFFISYYFFGGSFIELPMINIWAVTFFLIGSYLGINMKNLVTCFNSLSPYNYILCIVMLSLALCFYGTNWRGYFFRAYILSGVIAFFAFTALILDKTSLTIPKRIVNSTFFIFAAHLGLPLLSYIRKIIDILPDNNYYWMMLRYFLVPFCLIICCIIIYMLLVRLLPRTTKVICGR